MGFDLNIRSKLEHPPVFGAFFWLVIYSGFIFITVKRAYPSFVKPDSQEVTWRACQVLNFTQVSFGRLKRCVTK